MKKNYQKPAMRVVEFRHMGIICTSSGSKMVKETKSNLSGTDAIEVRSMHSNAGMDYVGSDASVADFDDDDIR